VVVTVVTVVVGLAVGTSVVGQAPLSRSFTVAASHQLAGTHTHQLCTNKHSQSVRYSAYKHGRV